MGEGLVALPEDARTREQLEWVADNVEAAHGSALLWRAELLSSRDEHRLVAQHLDARAQEYRDILQRARAGQSDPTVTGVTGRLQGRLLGQLRRELRRVRRRDYFPPPEAELARRAVEELADAHGPKQGSGAAAGRAGMRVERV